MWPRILVLLLLALPSPAAADEWLRAETANFVVFSDAGERRTREVIAEFERFREALRHVLPNVATTSPVPTTVVVFESERGFAPFLPKYNGKPVRLGGFFQGTDDDNTIALTLASRDDALRIVLHEYTHLITANASRALPVWVNEGIAEFYSTFAVEPSGKAAVLGRTVPGHFELLSSHRLLPVEEFATVDHSSQLYNEGQRRSIFYAQSWAIVHMFMTGDPARRQTFAEYVRMVDGGTPPLDAWRSAFAGIDVLKELARYVRYGEVRNYLYKFPEHVKPPAPQFSRPSAADVEAVLGRAHRYGTPDEMKARLRRAVAMAARRRSHARCSASSSSTRDRRTKANSCCSRRPRHRGTGSPTTTLGSDSRSACGGAPVRPTRSGPPRSRPSTACSPPVRSSRRRWRHAPAWWEAPMGRRSPRRRTPSRRHGSTT